MLIHRKFIGIDLQCESQCWIIINGIYTSKLKILQIIMWNIGMAQKAKETRSGCLVHIVQ